MLTVKFILKSCSFKCTVCAVCTLIEWIRYKSIHQVVKRLQYCHVQHTHTHTHTHTHGDWNSWMDTSWFTCDGIYSHAWKLFGRVTAVVPSTTAERWVHFITRVIIKYVLQWVEYKGMCILTEKCAGSLRLRAEKCFWMWLRGGEGRHG